MPKYPKTIYVNEKTEAAGDKWFDVSRDAIGHAAMGEKVRVGVYVLKETIEVKGVAITNKVG